MNILLWSYIVIAIFFFGIGVADNLSMANIGIRDYLIVAALSVLWPVIIIVGLRDTYV